MIGTSWKPPDSRLYLTGNGPSLSGTPFGLTGNGPDEPMRPAGPGPKWDRASSGNEAKAAMRLNGNEPKWESERGGRYVRAERYGGT